MSTKKQKGSSPVSPQLQMRGSVHRKTAGGWQRFCAFGVFLPRDDGWNSFHPFFVTMKSYEEVPAIASKELLINEQITDKEVRVVDSDGSQLGIMSVRDALDRAIQRNLDLVKIAPKANPPVCRIMDYGKFRFEQSKKEKEARKNQKQVEIKEIRLSVNIDTHDFNTKKNHTLRFLQEGNKVKVSVRFRGREMSHTSLGEARLLEFAEACKEFGNVDKSPKLEGRTMAMIINPLQK